MANSVKKVIPKACAGKSELEEGTRSGLYLLVYFNLKAPDIDRDIELPCLSVCP